MRHTRLQIQSRPLQEMETRQWWKRKRSQYPDLSCRLCHQVDETQDDIVNCPNVTDMSTLFAEKISPHDLLVMDIQYGPVLTNSTVLWTIIVARHDNLAGFRILPSFWISNIILIKFVLEEFPKLLSCLDFAKFSLPDPFWVHF